MECIDIDHISVRSLYLVLVAKGSEIGTATGFVVDWNNKPYLITNQHVVSGGNSQVSPDQVVIMHHTQELGNWVDRTESLFDVKGNPRWIEHPNGSNVDVIALPLEAVDDHIQLHPLDLSWAHEDMVIKPAMSVSIVGFPEGLTSNGMFPIWKTGHIASDPDLDYLGEPAFLIDATTRPGMSGSPVFRRVYEHYLVSSGALRMRQDGKATRFLGILSAQLSSGQTLTEIGLVWRPRVIEEILNQAIATSS